jgi:hypothetical protein
MRTGGDGGNAQLTLAIKSAMGGASMQYLLDDLLIPNEDDVGDSLALCSAGCLEDAVVVRLWQHNALRILDALLAHVVHES